MIPLQDVYSLRFTVINSKSFPVQWPVRTGNHAVNSPTRQTRFHGMLCDYITNDDSGRDLMTSLVEGTHRHSIALDLIYVRS